MYLASCATQTHVGDLVEQAFTILPQHAAANDGSRRKKVKVSDLELTCVTVPLKG